MALDLQKFTLYRLLTQQNQNFYSKLVSAYFTGHNLVLFGKITQFYREYHRLPSKEEFVAVKKDSVAQEYLESQVVDEEYENNLIVDDFIVAQLQDNFIREETIHFMDNFLDDLEHLEKGEIIDKFQAHLLYLNKAIPSVDELFDVGELSIFPEDDDFIIIPSGMSAEHDAINGGFALQELVLLGGRRGSGKSIITTNVAVKRFLMGHTVAFFSIEMRYKEVYDRILSMLSEVPFLDIFKNELSDEQKIKLARTKLDKFYKPDNQLEDAYENIILDKKDFKGFEAFVKAQKPSLTDNRLMIIDDESLTLSRIDHYSNMFASKFPNYTLSCVDYINIIKSEDRMDWKTQIALADEMKIMARKYNQTIVSPYQIDATGEARFAKGILDSADRSFIFFPPHEETPDLLTMMTSKVRNGKALNFDVPMNWECVKIDPNNTKINTTERPHKIAKYGDDSDKDKAGPPNMNVTPRRKGVENESEF